MAILSMIPQGNLDLPAYLNEFLRTNKPEQQSNTFWFPPPENLKRFDWTDTLLSETQKQAIEHILVDYHDIFARHRMEIGMNTQFKVKLTPKDDKVVYSQGLPMPIHLKEDLIIELSLMHKYGIIRVLPFSKNASPMHKGSRKINGLIADDYTNNNHPISTLSDAAQHLAGKSLFCKLGCSQAYHCLQMADH